jgi:hypothetical protein
MKYSIVFFLMLFSQLSIAQTNTFPSSGNVGIGTTSPQSLLHVSRYGNTAGGTILMGVSNDGAPKWSYLTSTQYNSSANPQGFSLIGGFTTATDNRVMIGGAIYEANPATSIEFYTHPSVNYNLGGSQRMIINSFGNVGIGTSSPANKLHLDGGKFIFTSDNASYGQFQINASSTSTESTILLSNGGSGQNNGQYTNVGVIGMGAYGNNKNILVLGTGYNNGTAFIKDNNVGLGTANPTEKLTVEGNIKSSGKASFGNNLKIFGTSESWAEGISIIRQDGWSGIRLCRNDPASGNYNGNWAIGYNVNTNNDFNISAQYEGAFYDNIFHITNATRNVGIGTTTPSEKLSVNGNIRAKKLIVTQNGWPDYVFSNNYKLRSIHEVENFIATNKHLPDMPSAKDIEEKGLDIGKMQAILLKKIEDLTLYIIELKRENKKVNERLEKIEQRK